MSCHRDGARTPADALKSIDSVEKRGKRQVLLQSRLVSNCDDEAWLH